MTSLYELTTDGGLRPTDSPQFPVPGAVDGVQRWVRMIGPQPHELRATLRDLELPDEVLENLYEDGLSSRVVTHGLGLVMMLPVVDPGEERAVPLRAACSPTSLVTIEDQPLPMIDRVVRERSGNVELGLTLPGLLIELLDAAAGSAGPFYLSLRRRIDDLAAVVEGNPQEVPAEDLLAIRNDVARLTMLWDDQIHGCMELKRCHAFISVSHGSRDLLRDLIADADRGLKLLGKMESRLRDLRQHQQQFQQESSNRRLNMLAILSSIYMPATLIAGLYGMNFEYIPVATLPYGYFLVMGFMAVVVMGHFWYFYRRGWFK